jgi:hypothetical protein
MGSCSDEGEWEGQQLTSWMCFDNTESEPGAQSRQFQSHPTPSCVSVCLKLQVQLFCGEPKKNPFGLFDCLSCAPTHVHMSSWHTKTSLGPSRHHLASGMRTHVVNFVPEAVFFPRFSPVVIQEHINTHRWILELDPNDNSNQLYSKFRYSWCYSEHTYIHTYVCTCMYVCV